MAPIRIPGWHALDSVRWDLVRGMRAANFLRQLWSEGLRSSSDRYPAEKNGVTALASNGDDDCHTFAANAGEHIGNCSMLESRLLGMVQHDQLRGRIQAS